MMAAQMFLSTVMKCFREGSSNVVTSSISNKEIHFGLLGFFEVLVSYVSFLIKFLKFQK